MSHHKTGVAIMLAALTVLAFAGCKDSSSGSNTPAGGLAHPEDYQVTACTVDAIHYPHATVKITNHSSGSSNYLGEVRFQSPDGKTQYGTGAVISNNLTPGQSTTQDAVGLQQVPAGATLTCELADADRMASY